MQKKLILLLTSLLLLPVLASAQEADKTLPGEGEVDETETRLAATILDDEDAIQEMLEQGDTEITLEDLVLEIDFSDNDDWEIYEEDARFVIVDDGVYIAEVEDNQIIWGQNEEEFDDGVISLVAQQDGGSDDNGYGVMCRANEENVNAEGYHFWISGEGRAAIALYVEDDGYDFLADWTETDAIDTNGENILHVVCVDEYLAFYVNGELVAEAEDDTYDEGVTGLSIRNYEDGEFARAIFDDLHIWEAND